MKKGFKFPRDNIPSVLYTAVSLILLFSALIFADLAEALIGIWLYISFVIWLVLLIRAIIIFAKIKRLKNVKNRFKE